MTAEEFAAREQQHLTALNGVEPPGMVVPSYLGSIRHECPGQRGVSKPVIMHEVFVPRPPEPPIIWEDGFVYQEGKCPSCGLVARSDTGRMVNRQPLVTARIREAVPA